MSADTVDDLHAAEDMAGALAQALAETLAGDPFAARFQLDAWKSYCRPTCGAEGSPVAAQETCEHPDTCGCPCGHAELLVGHCKHCQRRIVTDKEGRWVDPEATGDDSKWREVCDGHDTFVADHEPADTTPDPDPDKD